MGKKKFLNYAYLSQRYYCNIYSQQIDIKKYKNLPFLYLPRTLGQTKFTLTKTICLFYKKKKKNTKRIAFKLIEKMQMFSQLNKCTDIMVQLPR